VWYYLQQSVSFSSVLRRATLPVVLPFHFLSEWEWVNGGLRRGNEDEDGEDKASTCFLARFRFREEMRGSAAAVPARVGFLLGPPPSGPWRADQPRPVQHAAAGQQQLPLPLTILPSDLLLSK
jgi:hypothetical protein